MQPRSKNMQVGTIESCCHVAVNLLIGAAMIVIAITVLSDTSSKLNHTVRKGSFFSFLPFFRSINIHDSQGKTNQNK